LVRITRVSGQRFIFHVQCEPTHLVDRVERAARIGRSVIQPFRDPERLAPVSAGRCRFVAVDVLGSLFSQLFGLLDGIYQEKSRAVQLTTLGRTNHYPSLVAPCIVVGFAMGELLALLTAVLYSSAVILYKRSVVVVSPFSLNLFKNTLALILLTTTALLLGQTDMQSIAPRHLYLMLASGALGIGISDTLFLMTLKRLGASRTAVVDCLYSPFVILFSYLTVGEGPQPRVFLGGILILGSVVLSAKREFGLPMERRNFWIGCALGATAMATVAYAVVMLKPILSIYPLTMMSGIRMSGGLAFLILSLPFHRDLKSVYADLRPQRAWVWMVAGTCLGSYLSIVSWLAGFKYSQAGIAALLNQTSTVLVVVLAAIFLKEPMTRLKAVAVAMAFVGTAILFY
jgi:drug/metabolite transporter (DMT)-like permease